MIDFITPIPNETDLTLQMAREFDCGGGVRLVRDFDGTVEREGWFFSHWQWMPPAVRALWPLPSWSTAQGAYVALRTWRRQNP